MTLTFEQLEAIERLDRGENFLITGGAGCGKSYLVKQIVERKDLYKKMIVTASTGVAANLIEGMTIHSFAGIGNGDKSSIYYITHMQYEVRNRWMKTDVLIIDEISMIDAQTFQLLHEIACSIKRCDDELFGGIPIICSGDFFQLSPVKGDFVFNSSVWKRYMKNVVTLTECFRQKNDNSFFNALNEIRIGKVSEATVNYFMECHRKNDINLNEKATRLFFKREEVNKYNQIKMNQIPYEQKWFYSKDTFIINQNQMPNLNFQIPEQVQVKIGAIVMITKNISIEDGLCNGAIGIVKKIYEDGIDLLLNENNVKIELIKEDIYDWDHKIIAYRIGLPIQLAFALTVHKAQGMTLDSVIIDLNSNAFCKSLYYVGMSRVCKKENLFLIHSNELMLKSILKTITSDSKVKLFYKNESLRKRCLFIDDEEEEE